ncbi:hypothetical protein K443DRAFT_552132 [Laccaria amethystina LaAM-08-1]|uniref:Unplaced genomic scaffold K443scaffold_68, whole genome shotgun sequence n=1 Tax=Laccaria amethystina LaAM-08-1 TaxID=1095629 RepID=A0A0C9Y0R4_9AGAR|nr:hypothetical protein K443DRAFT_552132 [Laccaria amethystina LaAM-08-1]
MCKGNLKGRSTMNAAMEHFDNTCVRLMLRSRVASKWELWIQLTLARSYPRRPRTFSARGRRNPKLSAATCGSPFRGSQMDFYDSRACNKVGRGNFNVNDRLS